MSDLTDFFPATASGGGLNFDPMALDRRFANSGGIRLKQSATDSATVGEIDFWNKYGAIYDTQTISNNTDYFTVHNTVSGSAPNGGRLHNIIGPNVLTGPTNFKITIDGTEYIVTGETTGITSGIRYLLGGFAFAFPVQQSTTNTEYTISQSYESYFTTSGKNTTGGFINSRGNSSGNTVIVPPDPFNFNGIYFKETLKIDIQAIVDSPSSTYNNYAGAGISIL